MADVLPFTRKDFCGSLEVQGRLIATSKALRIQRLKEVRSKEKDVSDVGAEAYRQCIADRKAAKELSEKEKKRTEKVQELQILSKKWQNAVQESGAAHNQAKKNVDILLKKSEVESKISERRREEESRREKAGLRLRQEQILETQRASMRLVELQQTKREMRKSDREDARAHGEAYTARQELWECQREAIAHIHSVPVVYTQTRVQQGAVSIEQRFPVEVHAQVWRHGVAGAGGVRGAAGGGLFRAEVRNGAQVEEGAILRKTWTRVMSEMLTKIKTKKRAQTAKRTVEQHKGVLYLESELQRLEAADKAPSRQTRICSALGVSPDAEAPRLQGSFEKMFLSKPVRIDHKHIVYHTGSHLKKSNLEKHVQHQLLQDDGTAEARGEAEDDNDDVVCERNSFPIWHSEAPHAAFGLPAASSAADFCSSTTHTHHAERNARREVSDDDDSSGSASDELHVLSGGRMYQELDGCSTASDIPMISRPPPQWTKVPQEALGRTDAISSFHHTQQQHQNVDVRIPQVQLRGQAQPAAKRSVSASPSASPSSPSSVATSPSSHIAATSTSSFSDAVSMNSSLGSDSSGAGAASAPLSIQLKGVLDGVPAAGSITPPRHQGSRGSAGGPRPIDPFTPPEVALSSRRRQIQAEESDSAPSGASSTNTEQARHDRLQRFESEPVMQRQHLQQPVGPSTQLLNERRATTAPARATALHAAPLWTDDSDVDRSRESINMSALTEQMTFHDSEDEREKLGAEHPLGSDGSRDDDSSCTSSTVSELGLAQRALSSSRSSSSTASVSRAGKALRAESSSSISHQHRRPDSSRAGAAEDVLSSLDSSSLQSSTNSASSSAASRSSSASSASSSSSSMLSYLNSGKNPAILSDGGVTIAIVERMSTATTRPVPAPVAILPPNKMSSPAQSFDSDSVSMLSTTSDEIRFAAGQSVMRDSFAQLTRQELQGVLDDLSEDELESSVGDKNRGGAQPGAAERYLEKPVEPRTSTKIATEKKIDGGANATRSGTLSSDILRDYASMFESDSESESEEHLPPDPMQTAQHLPRVFPVLPHSIDRIEEESSEEENEEEEELEQVSLQSTSTGELFDNWQQLYRGTLQLGSQARALRSEHVAAYNASASAAASAAAATLSEEESFLSSEVEERSPPRQAALRSGTTAVPTASPLNVLVFPQDMPEFSKSSLYESDLRSSQSSQGFALRDSDDGSHSSDSLSPRIDRHASASGHSRQYEGHRTSVDVRASYENVSRATALMSELDKLSQDWRQKQAYYSKSHTVDATADSRVAPAPAPMQPPMRHPAEPPHYSSPPWLSSGHKPVAESTPQFPGHNPASLSSLSSLASPPTEPAAATSTTRREVYSGSLHVHSERRAYPVTAAHLPELAAQLELEDSLNSSNTSSSFHSGTEGRRTGGARVGVSNTLYSSGDDKDEGEDDESQNRSLEDLLNSHAGSETRGRIQSEIAAMRSRLLATVAAPAGGPISNELRAQHSAQTSSGLRSVVGAQSSGEDTYSSSRYFSAGEVRSASDSTMHTPDSGGEEEEDEMHGWRNSPQYIRDATLRTTSHSSTTVRATTTTSITSSATSRFTSHFARGPSSSFAASSTTAGGAGVGTGTGGSLHDDSGRAGAYSFTKQSPAPSSSNVTGIAVATHVSSADSSLVLQQMGSPGGGSVSRLSEYAMLSQHTLHLLQASPSAGGGEGGSPDMSRLLDRQGEESLSYDLANNIDANSRASDSSTFSEYMRHFPSRK